MSVKETLINSYYQIQDQVRDQLYLSLQIILFKMDLGTINSQFCFCSNEGVPNSLSMMRKPCYLMNQIYDMPQIIWIDGVYQQSIGQKNYICQQIGNKITCFAHVTNDVKEFVKKSKQIIIICSNHSSLQVNQNFSQSAQVISIICYCANKLIYEQNKNKKLLGQKFKLGTNNQNELIQRLKNQSKKKKLKQLPTFISMENQVEKSNTKMKTLSVCLRQQFNKEKIFEEFIKLIGFAYPGEKKQIEQSLKKKYSQNQFLQLCINLFSKQYYFQFLINSLLRSTSHPADIFVMQPFIFNIFNYIKNIYKNEKKQKNVQKFYRGGHISEKQLNLLKISVGKIVHNLGFLKVTEQIKEQYIQNVLFIIVVHNKARNSNLDFGYAKIGEEIFFNHLNSFKISKTEFKKKSQKNKTYYQIELVYGELAKNMSDFTQNQKYFKSLAQFQTNIMKSYRYMMIGSVLTDGNISLPGSQQYWKQYLQRAGNKNERKNGLINLGKTLFNYQKYQKSKQVFLELLNIRQKDSLGYATVLSNLALTCQKLNMNNEAINYYNKCIQAKKQLYSDPKHIVYSTTYNNLGKLYYKEKKYSQALEQFYLCKEIDMKNLGELHPNYALTLANIASVYYMEGKYGDAISNFNIAQEIQCSVLGENHPEHVCTLKNLLKVYQKTNNIYKTKQSLLKIQQIQKAIKQG